MLSQSKHERRQISPFDKLRANGHCSTNFSVRTLALLLLGPREGLAHCPDCAVKAFGIVSLVSFLIALVGLRLVGAHCLKRGGSVAGKLLRFGVVWVVLLIIVSVVLFVPVYMWLGG